MRDSLDFIIEQNARKCEHRDEKRKPHLCYAGPERMIGCPYKRKKYISGLPKVFCDYKKKTTLKQP